MRDNVCVFFTRRRRWGGRGKPQGRFRRLLVPYSPLAANCARLQSSKRSSLLPVTQLAASFEQFYSFW